MRQKESGQSTTPQEFAITYKVHTLLHDYDIYASALYSYKYKQPPTYSYICTPYIYSSASSDIQAYQADDSSATVAAHADRRIWALLSDKIGVYPPAAQ